MSTFHKKKKTRRECKLPAPEVEKAALTTCSLPNISHLQTLMVLWHVLSESFGPPLGSTFKTSWIRCSPDSGSGLAAGRSVSLCPELTCAATLAGGPSGVLLFNSVFYLPGLRLNFVELEECLDDPILFFFGGCPQMLPCTFLSS